MVYPRSFSHVGLSVPDVEEAVEFYQKVLGWTVVQPPNEVEEGVGPIGEMTQACFGKGFGTLKVAHIATGDDVGFELLEFPTSEHAHGGETSFKDWRGIFHFAVMDPNVEELADQIVKHGGKQLMPVKYHSPGEKPYRVVYCEDPFGNLIEIYSHNYEVLYLDS
ncbi:VOC family protein [Oceanobacillus sp. J11TS1]|uniref:VOC family protein n=1 Tax=Oceanobacillus sp. J11TS1 TaxID=2807191 RepID=UPI001B24C485|nr:VOC family protein [Oceanobacillus sp. J11TS1]GIO23828.1 glyoxalase [Oceanobacillus sp. J11TS1]